MKIFSSNSTTFETRIIDEKVLPDPGIEPLPEACDTLGRQCSPLRYTSIKETRLGKRMNVLQLLYIRTSNIFTVKVYFIEVAKANHCDPNCL